MPKFEDIIKLEAGTTAEESSEEQEAVSEQAESETGEQLDSRNFKRITKKDSVPEEEKVAFKEMQRRIKLDETGIIEDPAYIEKIINCLPNERQREVVKRKFFNDESFIDIGKSLGVTGSRVQQIFANALKYLESKDIEGHLKHASEKKSEISAEASVSQTQALKDLINKYIKFKNIEFRWGGSGQKRILDDILDYATKHNETISALDSKVFNEIYREMKRILKNKRDNYNEWINVRRRIIKEVEKIEEAND